MNYPGTRAELQKVAMAILQQAAGILTSVSDGNGYHSDLLKDLPTGGTWVYGLPDRADVRRKYRGRREAP